MTTPPQRDSRGRFLPRPLVPPTVPEAETHAEFPELDDAPHVTPDPPQHMAWLIGGVIVVLAIVGWVVAR